jgi:CRP/FNR family cyclic AMP-dependent transcriptional regulator
LFNKDVQFSSIYNNIFQAKECTFMSKIWENIFKFRQKKTDEIENLLLHIPIFQDLKHFELQSIKRILHQREYKKDEVIFHQGDVGLGMYIVEEGTVEIISDPGRHALAILEKGDFFGEVGLLDDSLRSATAISKTHCKMLCFFKPELLDIINRNPRLGSKILFKLAWTIGERLKITNEQLRELKSRS